jgi:hypothetical protein
MDQPRSSIPGKAIERGESAATVALQAVADAIGRLRFGVVQLTVHEGRVVQLEVTERQRFT